MTSPLDKVFCDIFLPSEALQTFPKSLECLKSHARKMFFVNIILTIIL